MYIHTLAVPPPLRGADAGSFAEHSIVHRLPHIAQRVVADTSLTSAMRYRIEALLAAIPHTGSVHRSCGPRHARLA